MKYNEKQRKCVRENIIILQEVIYQATEVFKSSFDLPISVLHTSQNCIITRCCTGSVNLNFCLSFANYKLTSVFNASVLLLIMSFVITLSK